MRYLLLLSLLLTFSSGSAFAAVESSAVTVDAGDLGQFSYRQRPRLTEVLNSVSATDPALYWPAARLYLDDALHSYSFERKRQYLTEKLTLLAERHAGSTVVAPLLDLVKTARLAAPVTLQLDPDAVSAKAALNPLLDNGKYLLRVTKRPAELLVLGFAGQHQVSHSYLNTVRDYSKELSFDLLADQNFVYVLGADLSIGRMNRTLWGESKQQIRPGSVLYIPLNESALPDTFQGFNQSMLEFLQHRVVSE